jgi:hypothetical protein
LGNVGGAREGTALICRACSSTIWFFNMIVADIGVEV